MPCSAARRRACSIMRDDRSTPNAAPSGAASRAASRVVSPLPHPTSRTRSQVTMAAASKNRCWYRATETSKVTSCSAQYAPSAPSHARRASALAGWASGALISVIPPPLLLYSPWELRSTPKGRIMSTGTSMTTTSYAILGLLAIKPWTTYDLIQQVDRSLRRIWPRAQSKLYEEPKKLVALGFARASEEQVGKRRRTRYTITARGR